MVARVLAVANQKGGVGKTTTALTLAGALTLKGRRVLVMDLDPHVSASVHLRFYPDQLQHTALDIFRRKPGEKWREIWSPIIQTVPVRSRDGEAYAFDFAPGHIRLADLDVDLAATRGKGSLLLRALMSVAPDYDYVILDCPPHLGVLLVNAVMAAGVVLIPIQTEYLALNGLRLVFETIRNVNRVRKEPVQYRALPTMFDSRASACRRVLAMLRAKLGPKLLETVIHHDTKLREASGKGALIYDLFPESRGALEYMQLAKEIEAL